MAQGAALIMNVTFKIRNLLTELDAIPQIWCLLQVANLVVYSISFQFKLVTHILPVFAKCCLCIFFLNIFW